MNPPDAGGSDFTSRRHETTLRATAEQLRDPQVTSPWAALGDPHIAELAGQLFDAVADRLGHTDSPVRELTARVAREITGVRMDRPAVRRTRRR